MHLYLAAILLTTTTALAQTVLDVSTFPGIDLGAKITAADTTLGSRCGTLIVAASLSGQTITTSPTLSPCHTLQLNAALTWRAAPHLFSNTTILGSGEAALQTMPSGIWISSANLSQITFRNLWVTNPSTTDRSQTLLRCAHCSNIVFSRIHAIREGLLATASLAPNYAQSTPQNSSSNIQVEDSFVDGLGFGITAVLLDYTNRATINNLTVQNLTYGVQWWGGDSNFKVNGDPHNPRLVTDIHIDGIKASQIVSAVWGSMGQNINVNNVVADTCADVCIDAEGSSHVTFSNYTLSNARNGGIAAFYASQDVTLGPGTSTCDHAAGCTPAHMFNASLDPTLSVRVTIHDTQFICRDTEALCTFSADPVGGLTLTHNTFLNSTFIVPFNASGVALTHNTFRYTLRPAHPFNAVSLSPGGDFSSNNTLTNNTIASTVPQPTGSYAIAITDSDYNHSNITTLTGNSTSGFATDVLAIAASGNAGMTPTFRFSGNHFGNNSVTTQIKGAHGNFIGLP